ncbi:MAG: MFS transporter [Chloroflexota bacterium]|nr:MFS transporter [Chloroflexota bacterium]
MNRRPALWFLVYSAFFHAGVIGMMDVLLNFYFVSLGHDPQTISALQSLPRLAGFLTSIPVGLLCNRLGARSMLLWASIGCSAALGVLLFPTLTMLGVARFLFGMCYGAQQIASAPLMMGLVAAAGRTRFFSLHNVVSMVSMGVGSFTGGRVPALMIALFAGSVPAAWTASANTPFAYASSIALAAGVGLIGSIPLLFVKTSLPLSLSPQSPPSLLLKTSARDEKPPRLNVARGEVRIPWGMLAFVSIPMLTFGFTGGLTFPFYNLFFRTQFALPDDTVGTIISIGWIGMALIPMLNGAWERRLGRAGALGLTMTIAAVAFFGLGLLLPLAISAIFFVVAISFRNTMQPLYQPLVLDRLPPSLHNIASSMTMIMWNIGWFAATAISGTLQTTIGFGLIMQIVAVGVLLNGAAVVLIFRSKRADMPIRFAAQQESNA